MLLKSFENEESVIVYFSENLTKPEINYCITRKELLTIVKSAQHFHHYIYNRKFTLQTNHASLKWILSIKEPECQIVP